jgi:hypothetical protein
VPTDCLVLEGGSRLMFDHLTMEMGWPAGPPVPMKPDESRVNVTSLPISPGLIADAGRPTLPTAP